MYCKFDELAKFECKFDELDKFYCKLDELDKLYCKFDELDKLYCTFYQWYEEAIGTASADSVGSELGCTMMVFFDDVTLTSQITRQHNNKCGSSETNDYTFHNEHCYK